MEKKGKKSKTQKKDFSLSIGTIVIIIVIIIAIIALVCFIRNRNTNTVGMQDLYETTNNMYSDSKLKSVDENTNYKNNKKITIKDLNIGGIYCQMSLDEMLEVLGDADSVYDATEQGYDDVTYKRYRYNDKNLVVDIDNETQTVKKISSYGEDLQNDKGITMGSTSEEVIAAYHSEKKIGIYENNFGTYEVLYNSDDVFDYLYNETTDGKSFGYIYEYIGDIYTIEYVEDNLTLTFEFLNNEVCHISMSC